MHQNAQICKLNLTNFLGALPPDPVLGRGYGPLLTPYRLGATALLAYRASLGAFGSSISSAPSVPIVPVLRNAHGSYRYRWRIAAADAAGVVAMTAQRDCVRVLRGAVPGRDFRSGDTPPYSLLPVQHHLSMPVAQRAQCDGLLAAGRFR